MIDKYHLRYIYYFIRQYNNKTNLIEQQYICRVMWSDYGTANTLYD